MDKDERKVMISFLAALCLPVAKSNFQGINVDMPQLVESAVKIANAILAEAEKEG